MNDIQVKQMIDSINYNLPISDTSQYGLIGSNAGITLFRVYLYAYTKDEKHLPAIEKEIEDMFDAINDSQLDCSFGYGLAGFIWLLKEVERFGILEPDEDLISYTNQVRQIVIQSIYSDIHNNNMDFLSGFLGKAISLLPLHKDDEYIIEDILIYLESKVNGDISGLYNLSFNDGMPPGEPYINLGLAHGLPAVLQFCTLCCENGLYKDKVDNLATIIIDFLIGCADVSTKKSYYSYYLQKNGGSDDASRLGWCYGDLSLSLVLYQASIVFKHKIGKEHALQVIMHTTTRRSLDAAEVFDAGICHGSSGLAHMYNKIWKLTAQESVKDTRDYWIDICLNQAKQEDGLTFYEKYDANTNSMIKNFSLIEGAAGIGMVLLTYLSEDFNWDRSFLLS